MFEYIFIFILLLFLSIHFDIFKRGENYYNFFTWIAVGCLILMEGLRNGIGSDTHNYASFFNNCPTLIELFLDGKGSIDFFSQPLWLLVNSTVKSVWDNFIGMQILHALVFNILLVRFLKRTTKYIFSCLLVIYCVIWWNLSFEVMRESICVVLLLNSLQALKDGHIKSYFLWNISSIFIHWFALPIILLVFICNYIPFKTWLIYIISGIIVFRFLDASLISSVIMQLSAYSGDTVEEHLQDYLSQDSLYGFSTLNIFGILHKIIVVLPYIFIIYYLSITKDEKGSLILNILLLYIFFNFIGAELRILYRYLNYLTPIALVSLVEFVYIYYNKKMPIMHIFFLIMLISTCYNGYLDFKLPPNNQFQSNVNYYHIPYTSIFEEQNQQREEINY